MKAHRILLGILVGTLVLLGAAYSAVYFSESASAVREFEKRFSRIDIGDAEGRVLTLLGAPESRESAFRIGQEKGFEAAYVRTRASGAKEYLIWTRGIDVVFTIGIDENGIVRAKEYGGT